MVNIEVVRLSSKGQLVIPSKMRKNMKEGDELFIIKDGERLIIKKAESLGKDMKEDLEFARRTEEALKRIESGEYISVDSENLVEEMMGW